MRRNYRLSGLDCAHCAEKLERSILKVNGVKGCNINFLTRKMTVEVNDDNAEEVLAEIAKISAKAMPSLKMMRC